MNLIYSVSFQF